MMNRLVRPMTIEDEQGDSITIDALDVTDFDVLNCMLTIEHQYQEHLHFPSKSTSEIFRMFNAKLYEALNAPVLATKEVLAGLPKDVQFLVYRAWGDPPKENPFQHCNLHPAYLFRKNDKEAYNWYFTDAIIVDKGLRHSPVLGFHIKSNGCPKTAKYLLQFYTDGTPVVVK